MVEINSLSKLLFAGSSYAGLGPPATPPEIQHIFRQTAEILSGKGCVLRSGGEEGGDAAFESGSNNSEIFLPYQHFNKNISSRYQVEPRCFDIIKATHPAWHRCSEYAKKSHGRHVYQILGERFDSPAAVLICWTPDGAIEASGVSGRTGALRTAIVLASNNSIPVINAGNADHKRLLELFVRTPTMDEVRAGIQEIAGVMSIPVRRKGFRTLHPEDY